MAWQSFPTLETDGRSGTKTAVNDPLFTRLQATVFTRTKDVQKLQNIFPGYFGVEGSS
jgi:hypothetical protein